MRDLSKCDIVKQKLCQKVMRHISLQQISDFSDKSQKIDKHFVLLEGRDIGRYSGIPFIGCRIISLVCRGTVNVRINGRVTILSENDFADVLEGTKLQFDSASDDSEFYCIFTTRKYIMDALQGTLPRLQNYILKIMTNPVMRLETGQSSVLKNNILLMAGKLADVGNLYRQELLNAYLKAFALEIGNLMSGLYGTIDDVPLESCCRRDMLMVEFMDLVWRNFIENRSVAFYAKQLCVTPKQLARVVKDASGKSPHEIISSELFSLSVQLLQDESLLVQQVSDMLHFSDQAAFTKFFKKYTGVPPADYRKNRTE